MGYATGGGIGWGSAGRAWKKAMASNSADIHTRSKPKPNAMIKAAPIKRIVPVVPNKPTPDFSDS